MQNLEKYRFGLDWLNGYAEIDDIQYLFSVFEQFSSKLRFDRWVKMKNGLYNYSVRYCLNGQPYIQFMYNPLNDIDCSFSVDMDHNNKGVFFSISGDGIRYLKSLGGDINVFDKLLYFLNDNNFKCSRFDVYCDILDNKNRIVPLLQKTIRSVGREKVGQPAFCTKFNRSNYTSLRKNFVQNEYLDDNGKKFNNVTIGNHGSNRGMFRCYNKFIEVKDSRLSSLSKELFKEYKVENYWYRLEYEMHKETANDCFQALMTKAVKDNVFAYVDIFSSCFMLLFKIIDIKSMSGIPNQPLNVDFQEFYNFLLSYNIDFVSFGGGVPYIKTSITRLSSNADRISAYYFAITEYLNLLSYDDREKFLFNARIKFNQSARYNLLRDEFAEIQQVI